MWLALAISVSICFPAQDRSKLIVEEIAKQNFRFGNYHTIIVKTGYTANNNINHQLDYRIVYWRLGDKIRVDLFNHPNGPNATIPRVTVGMNWPKVGQCIGYIPGQPCTIREIGKLESYSQFFLYCFDPNQIGFDFADLSSKNSDEDSIFSFLKKNSSLFSFKDESFRGRTSILIHRSLPENSETKIYCDPLFDFFPIYEFRTKPIQGKSYRQISYREPAQELTSRKYYAKTFTYQRFHGDQILEDVTYNVDEVKTVVDPSVFTLEGLKLPDGTPIFDESKPNTRSVLFQDDDRIRKDGEKALLERLETQRPPEPTPSNASNRQWTFWIYLGLLFAVLVLIVLVGTRMKGRKS